MNQFHLSRERLEELKRELGTLKGEKRAEIAENLKRAKEYGDLSENSEYAEARDEQNFVESRISQLEDIVKNAKIIEKVAAPSEIGVGSTAKVMRGGEALTYTIVGSYDANPESGKISDESPLGKALLGRKVGERVSVQTPAGVSDYVIQQIS